MAIITAPVFITTLNQVSHWDMSIKQILFYAEHVLAYPVSNLRELFAIKKRLLYVSAFVAVDPYGFEP